MRKPCSESLPVQISAAPRSFFITHSGYNPRQADLDLSLLPVTGYLPEVGLVQKTNGQYQLLPGLIVLRVQVKGWWTQTLRSGLMDTCPALSRGGWTWVHPPLGADPHKFTLRSGTEGHRFTLKSGTEGHRSSLWSGPMDKGPPSGEKMMDTGLPWDQGMMDTSPPSGQGTMDPGPLSGQGLMDTSSPSDQGLRNTDPPCGRGWWTQVHFLVGANGHGSSLKSGVTDTGPPSGQSYLQTLSPPSILCLSAHLLCPGLLTVLHSHKSQSWAVTGSHENGQHIERKVAVLQWVDDTHISESVPGGAQGHRDGQEGEAPTMSKESWRMQWYHWPY